MQPDTKIMKGLTEIMRYNKDVADKVVITINKAESLIDICAVYNNIEGLIILFYHESAIKTSLSEYEDYVLDHLSIIVNYVKDTVIFTYLTIYSNFLTRRIHSFMPEDHPEIASWHPIGTYVKEPLIFFSKSRKLIKMNFKDNKRHEDIETLLHKNMIGWTLILNNTIIINNRKRKPHDHVFLSIINTILKASE